ncbi:hypothetical protein CEXT_104401 [Caerostris extrusa]|uniref:Uncharacterized protein n=1 Tax=Caerostris extrusa TaxID=172846 RepID=A0AAV4Y8R9_CAEEX|nr:hypothetical protein CEXT_104401 [Caerostris extrusa]
MDRICSTEFWNWNLTWSTTTPVFTSCFIKIGLIWVPIAFFWIFAPLEIYYMIRTKGHQSTMVHIKYFKIAYCVSVDGSVFSRHYIPNG